MGIRKFFFVKEFKLNRKGALGKPSLSAEYRLVSQGLGKRNEKSQSGSGLAAVQAHRHIAFQVCW